MRRLAPLFLLASTALAQSDGILASVSRTVTIAPDEGDFTVSVTATLDTTQQQVIQIFQNAGIEDLTAVALGTGSNGSAPPAAGDLYYRVAFTVLPPALATYIRKLDAMRANPPAGLKSVQYSAALTASQAAVDSARQGVLPQLVSDARSKVQALASAAGLKLGPIQGITESGAFGSALGIARAGDFSAVSIFNPSTGGSFASFLLGSPASGGNGIQQTFSLSVTFAVAGQ